MDKSPDAFRTISEVAEALETPAHVLRFWESRFPQIKPVKRAGGRRYYRPADVALLGGIRHLLHNEGMTIRGVQKILREHGVRHVAAMAPGGDMAAFDLTDDEDFDLGLTVSGEEPAVETAQVLAMDAAARRDYAPPETPAEVVQLRSPAVVPDLSEGFILPTANRRPLPTLDPEPPMDDVPEAGHVWVDDDLPEEEPPIPLMPAEAGQSDLYDMAGDAEAVEAETPATSPDLPDLPDLTAQAVMQDLFADLEPPPADVALPDLPGVEEAPELADAMADAVPVSLAGIAARLRALPRPLTRQAMAELTELQMRLGLLHAQMVEAQRPRR